MSDIYSTLSFEEIKPEDIPAEYILEHPAVKDLAQDAAFLDGLIPYVLKDKLLMEPGIWNNHAYTAEDIRNAFLSTDWNDRHVKSLFLDHEDERTSEWVGEVQNVRYEKGKLIGDLYIYDLPTAIKLKYGKPKIGISPSIQLSDRNFVFRNFSLVVHPAVKTTYINNAQNAFTLKEVERMAEEEKVEQKPEQTEPKEEEKTEEQPQESQEQTEQEQEEQKSLGEEEMKKKKKDEKYPKYPEAESDEELSAYTDFVKEKRKLGWSFEKIAKAWKAKKMAEELSDEELETLLEELKKKKKKKEEYPYPKLSEIEKKVENMSRKLEQIEKPVRLSVKAETGSNKKILDLSRDYSEKEVDEMMMEYLQKELQGVAE